MCIWVLLLNQVGTLHVLERVHVFQTFLRGTSSKQNQGQAFAVVGFLNCSYTGLANRVLAKIKLQPKEVAVHSWSAPSKGEFFTWLDKHKASGQVPVSHVTSPVVFWHKDNQRNYLGGASDLLMRSQQLFPDIDFAEEIRALEILDHRPRKKVVKKKEEQGNKSTKDRPVVTVPRRIEPPTYPPTYPPTFPPTYPPTAKNFLSMYAENRLEPQFKLKPNKLYTTYRLAEGKHVTNHRPIASSLKDMGWGMMISAPLMASWILVMDQASAAYCLKRYKNALINNIGYGGQSCFGGSKGKQLSCRQELAKQHGCDYEALDIQPAQYRLWIREECHAFFDKACVNEPERLWLEKPSKGQHGVGMKVRQGCDELSATFGSCRSDFSRQMIAMPYLDPALIGGHKFDVRTFLLVGSLDPQIAFYHDGFARKANNPYSSNAKDTKAHITNANSQSLNDHFYSFSRLQDILHRESGFPADYMTRVFREHAIKVQNFIFQVSRPLVQRRKATHQIFALDWIIDSRGRIHLLEANSNPLVTIYDDMREEYTQLWRAMTELVLNLHTDPAKLFTEEFPRLTTAPGRRYQYNGWHLIFNELEEMASGTSYNACKQDFKQNPLTLTQPTTHASVEEINPGSALSDEDPDTQVEEVSITEEEQQQQQAEQTSTENSSKEGEPKVAPPLRTDAQQEETGQQPKSTGAAETPYAVAPEEIKSAIRQAASKPCVPIDFYATFKSCVRVDRNLGVPDDHVVRCEYANEAYLYLIEPIGVPDNSTKCLPIVVVTAGVHGNEPAGITAARHIRKTWRVKNARLVVVERLNYGAIQRHQRYIPKVPKSKQDLNRNFPVSGLVGTLAEDIWKFVQVLQPHFYMDLHEGWGFYNRLRANYVKGGQLVGNPKFSKGSSVIASQSALPIAQYLCNKVNDQTVTDKTKDFLAIVPPIETGLASMVNRELGTQVIVVETTSKQPLFLRGKQQLILVGSTLKLFGMLPAEFDETLGFTEAHACVAGNNPGCKLEHPGDILY